MTPEERQRLERERAPLVFITGASSGIGRALAEAYAARGWRLALVARRAEGIQAWLDEAGIGPEQAQVHAADVRDREAIVAAMAWFRALSPELLLTIGAISILRTLAHAIFIWLHLDDPVEASSDGLAASGAAR